ncbi:MAG TPA: hypothetical protein DCY15_03270 [Ruminococcaceae bacterium]|nr:hypothetical protein [Oscillospiraceae bacterium]
MENKRIIYPDVIRIVSAFAVVTIHVIGFMWDIIPIKSADWLTLAIYNGFSRFSVPVFVMVSGMFILNPQKEKPIKDLYTQNILRICTSYVFWSAIYLLFRFFISKDFSGINGFELIKSLIGAFLNGDSHMWFMPMIVGLYIAAPILKKVTANKKIMEYYLIVWFVLQICLGFIGTLPYLDFAAKVFDSIYMPVALNYSGYFVLDYYLSKYPLSKKTNAAIYVLGGLGAVCSIVMTIFFSLKAGKPTDKYLDYLLPTTALYSIAVFIFFKERFEKKAFGSKSRNMITRISLDSFGIYLCHLLFVRIIFLLPIELHIPVIIRVPVLVVIAFAFSLLMSALLNRIPGVKKYIV